jgi:spore coat protein A, manganese oxidase
MKTVNRRSLLKLAAIASASFLLPAGIITRGFAQARSRASRKRSKKLTTGVSPTNPLFQVPLPIMPVLKPVRSDKTADYYEITQITAQAQILSGAKTEIWGYNGVFPGPTIKARVGKKTVIKQTNSLPPLPKSLDPTVPNPPPTDAVVHLHGMASQPEYDGYVLDTIPPGQSREYIYPNDHAATYWYHDHALGLTGKHIFMGLLGMYIVQDKEEDVLRLPKGKYDVPLIIGDRKFNADNSFLYDPDADTILVNGAVWPFMQVKPRNYRFRILNSSVSRAYELALSSGKELTVVGTDQGLMSAPQNVKSLNIGPGERYEVVIDFSVYQKGTQVVLQNLAEDSGTNLANIMRFDVGNNNNISAAAKITDSNNEEFDSAVPSQLRTIQTMRSVMSIPESAAVRTRLIKFDSFLDKDGNPVWTLNGKGWNPDVFIAEMQLGDVEIWTFENTPPDYSPTEYHVSHLHGIQFRILDRNGQPPFPYERGIKDSVFLGPNETVRVLARFGPNKGKYMFHCHVVDHEDNDMMTQFRIL